MIKYGKDWKHGEEYEPAKKKGKKYSKSQVVESQGSSGQGFSDSDFSKLRIMFRRRRRSKFFVSRSRSVKNTKAKISTANCSLKT